MIGGYEVYGGLFDVTAGISMWGSDIRAFMFSVGCLSLASYEHVTDLIG